MLKENSYKDGTLINKFDNYYITHYQNEIIYYIPITFYDARRYYDAYNIREKIKNKYLAINISDKSLLIKKVIRDYLKFALNSNDEQLKMNLNKLEKHWDICMSLYNYLINDNFVKDDIAIENFTPKYLYQNYNLSIIGVYNYMIYLRENPVEAIKTLQYNLQ